MLKYKGGLIPSPVIEAQYADGTALKLSFWCDKNKGIDPQAGIRFANLVHASSAWDKANAARLEKAYYRPPFDDKGNRVIDGAKAIKARVVLDELNAERVAFVRANTDQPITVFITHPSLMGRWRPEDFETAKPKKPARGVACVKFVELVSRMTPYEANDTSDWEDAMETLNRLIADARAIVEG